MGMHSLARWGRGVCSMLGILGSMAVANNSKNREGACSMLEAPRKGNFTSFMSKGNVFGV